MISAFALFFLLFAFFFDFRFDLLQSRNLPRYFRREQRKNGIKETADCFLLSVDYTLVFFWVGPCKRFFHVDITIVVIPLSLQSFCFRAYSSVSPIDLSSRAVKSLFSAVRAITCSCSRPRFRGISPLFASVKASA